MSDRYNIQTIIVTHLSEDWVRSPGSGEGRELRDSSYSA